MFGWFSRSQAVRRPSTLRAHLYVEKLDERAVPAVAAFSTLNGRIIGSKIVVYGEVSDDGPGADVVTASGAVSGTYSTAGRFEFIGDYTGSGSVSLWIRDDEGLDSQMSCLNLQPSGDNVAPYVSFAVTYGAQKTVTFSGMVIDESPTTCSVTISGAASATATTNSVGSFSVTVSASSLGVANAVARDAQNLDSNTASLTLTSAKPVIFSFAVEALGSNRYRLYGQVVDESPEGLVVYFGGPISGIAGQTAVCNTTGHFETTVTITGTQAGYITADVTDWWGLAANPKSRWFEC